ncbi:MAG: DegV family protein [Trueperaceae bacterium]|nr:DegV family protein [Trueperaceae bacterium]
MASDTADGGPVFDVITDGGLDAYGELLNDVPYAPFTLNFGPESFLANALPRDAFFARLRAGDPHPTTSQPSPEEFAALYREAARPLLVVTISSGLSGSMNAADQARALAPDAQITLHDCRTLSAAQAFAVHAAMTARERDLDLDTALDWMRRVHAETELFFTIDTLAYLRRGGRIGRVQAALGGLMNLKPIVQVDKTTGTYVNAARARSWPKAIDEIAAQITARYGSGTPLRVALVYGEDVADAERLLEALRREHPVPWSAAAPIGAALAVHTGPKAVGLAVAPAAWPWESD